MSSYLFKSNVNEYLEGLPESVQSRLYQSPATCLAIYRLLPGLAKFFIMSMVFNEKPQAVRDFDSWVKPNGKMDLVEALRSIKSLHLLKEANGIAIMNPVFRKSFRNVLTGNEIGNSFGVLCDTDDTHKVSVEFLDQYAANKWETILHFMVGTELEQSPSPGVLSLLTHSGLMEGKSVKDMLITNEGFQFLLQDVNAQLWTLLLQYLRMAESLQMDPVDVLNFIFMLGSLELGKDYSLSALSETQVNMLGDLRDYGLIYQRKSTSRRFYPTRLATTLTSDTTSLRSASSAMNKVIENAKDSAYTPTNIENSGTIIIETNFKVYAYTNSPLQIAILNLFVHLKARFSNLVTGQITRESIRKALVSGITSEQIISYLESHAHPQLRRAAEEELNKKNGFESNNHGEKIQILQPTIADQIKLWQLELDRIMSFDGYLFTDFSSDQEYQVLSKYSEEIGVLLWNDSSKKKFFVTKEGNSQVIAFANRRLKKKA
ncbi:RNA polymerase II transcription factor B subunit 2 [Wickerhamomyces ciferrii]|uniref:RNA polymerase II transcription factor B subunit 2 n=1 Tax=Wickerhamomyces ciferrii (strain ATCC 14091 / BCRC 22168 / CBS 111 / JCM 3599 / NBRC 0793 / NRRL Y-1031 F-60-10) TaxID=1206466 RepID=K0KNV0_WICCF|nr:RNA polymerase II transcription factor B subunit 2 [Wickerhamomyces ciferrii]CCH43852.1 RNA polymerase II transcription factor B subunit 2 [Wickerhamomyces ciferrii]